jgi:hypothetical protein
MNPRVRLAVVFLLLLVVPLRGADDVQSRRAEFGVRLFRTLLAADLDLAKKTVENNQLLVVFYYVDDKRRAEELAARFVGSPPEKVRDMTVVAEVTNDPAFAKYGTRAPAAVFIAQPPNASLLRSVIKFGIDRRLIVYSPFEGHVERGVLGGIAVEAQVRPFVNLATLEASHVSLKSFFLQVTKVYR